MICIDGCLTILLFMIIKQAISMTIGIIALPICVSKNPYRRIKNRSFIVKVSIQN